MPPLICPRKLKLHSLWDGGNIMQLAMNSTYSMLTSLIYVYILYGLILDLDYTSGQYK